jgi:hypothetical protein
MTTVYIGKTLDKQNLRPKISSNSSMEPIHNTQQTVDARITELEIKASYTEDLLDQLDKVIVRSASIQHRWRLGCGAQSTG